ncbi:hypothetical protein [Novosphingobium sp. B1]|uniref:hypothetical protein n=1 Tax=Novosphingobium sp. B1 TaxID=1938756 RepID=UPI0009D86FAF|nr:hypothetical protein [Novosphingobium sp. B1]SMC55769.1 hypothetical protein SAMN06272759_10468 [Novosphingobium sp. B1]
MKTSALTALLIGASSLALATRAQAQEVVFADNADLAASALRGERVTQGSGVTQIRLSSGAMLSFVEGAEFQLRPDGTVDLFKGNVTVTGAGTSDTVVRLGGEGSGKISGAGSSGSFSVGTDANGRTRATGRVLTGLATIANGRETKRFNAGQAWEVANGHPRLATSAPPATVPQMTPQRQAQLAEQKPASIPAPASATEPQVAAISEGGPVAAAENGVPVVLGEALAAAGASGDIVSSGQRIEAAVANPSIETFPSNDLAALVAYAARLESLYGGQPFSQAQADVIRAYLNFLASGQSQAQFLTVYAGLMVQFLDLVRSGAAPSSFSGTSLADINAFISYRSRTDGFAALSSQNRVLVDAYLAFVLGGGNADQFVTRYTSLTSAYFAYLRSGGDPLAFQGATQATLSAYIIFLNQSGLLVRLAESDRALLQAYLANGGTAFIQQYRVALSAYFAYLQSGQLPSAYPAVDAATLRQYLETLQATGLFEQVLGAQATFYAQYLAYLEQGGTIDGWQGLPVNVFAGYATALQAYYAFLQDGGLPSAYTALTQDEIRQYLAALSAAGANETFLGQLASFYSAFFTYLANGGNPDLYTGLPTPPNYQAFAEALSAYVAYLQAGGLPSAYTGADLALLQQYIKALIDSGKLVTLLGAQAEFVTAYYAFLAGGGTPDSYAALPVYADYVAALEAYYAFIAAGGKPSAYTLLTQEQIVAYLKALTDAGVLAALFDGTTLAFIQNFYVYLAGGGNPDQFSGLPTAAPTRVGYNTSAEGTLVASPVEADVTSDGKISRLRFTRDGSALDFNYAANPANVVKEYGSFGDDAAWTRYLSDTANNAVNFNNHLLVGTPATTIPASGKVDYRLVGGTAPTDYNAPEGQTGTFTGSLAVSFGTTPRVGLAMDVATANRAWHVQTAGGALDPTNGGLVVAADRSFVGNATNLATSAISGGGCVSTCTTTLNGNLFGQNAAYAGFAYSLTDRTVQASQVNGVAIFGQGGTALPYLGATSGTGSASIGSGNYAGGFVSGSANTMYVSSQGASGYFNNVSSSVESDGRFSSNSLITPGTARFTDLAGDTSGVIGRLFDGDLTLGGLKSTYGANGGLAYVLMAPITGALPLSGSITYDLIAATKPVYNDAHTAAGTFEASLRIGFGTALTYAMSGTITMPDATYTFGTPGGVNGTLQAAQAGNDPVFVVIRPTLSQTGPACVTSGCLVNFYGGFGGATPENRIGFGYTTIGGNAIVGAALFGKQGTLSSAPSVTTLANATTLSLADGGTSAFSAQEVDIAGDGAITRVKLNANSTTSYASPSVLKEHGRAGDAIAWSRWDNVSTNANLNPNTHIVTGTPAVNLPATGKIDYALAGSTAPTNYNGADGNSGTVSGTLAVQFGTQAKVGFSLAVNAGARGWTVATAGGSADPSNGGLQVGTNMRFASASVGLTPLNKSSCLSSCTASVVGGLYGEGASHVGLGYQISDLSSNSFFTVNGTAIFARPTP